jgi:hypothetical protein
MDVKTDGRSKRLLISGIKRRRRTRGISSEGLSVALTAYAPSTLIA